jgi:hypothetical protein
VSIYHHHNTAAEIDRLLEALTKASESREVTRLTR